jgi:hypothetical protein
MVMDIAQFSLLEKRNIFYLRLDSHFRKSELICPTGRTWVTLPADGASNPENLRAGGAAAGIFLNGRTWHVAMGAEHAAIAGFGFEARAAPLAVVEKKTGVRRHRLQ